MPDASPEVTSEAEPEPEETVTVQDTHTHDNESYIEWTDQLAQNQNGAGQTAGNSLPYTAGNYYLSADVTLSDTWTVPSGGVKLCLNGKKVTGPTKGSVIKIDSGGSLSLYDESGGQIVGTATGNNRPDFGGVHVNNNGSFTMNGGTISGCSAEWYGGGVYVFNNSSFTMKGGTISGCSVEDYGGGVYNGGSFTMHGGTITGCSDNYGGGVDNWNSFTMKGDTISGCSASSKGGGVYSYGTFNLSGKPVITGNKKGGSINNGVLTGGTDNNVYLKSGKFLTVTGALETGAKVGVTLGTSDGKGVFTTGWNTHMSEKKPSDYFTSDLAKFSVRKTSDGNELELYNTPATAPNITALTSLTGDDTLTYGYTSGSISVTASAAAGHELSYEWYTCNSDGTGGAAIDTVQEPTAETAAYTIPTGKNAGPCYYRNAHRQRRNSQSHQRRGHGYGEPQNGGAGLERHQLYL